jgi:HEAT repeat protein
MGLFGPPNVDKLKGKRDFKGLAKAITDDDPEIRDQAKQAIVELGSPDAVPPMLDALDGEQGEEVVLIAADALRGIGDPAAAALVQSVKLDTAQRKLVAAGMLGRMGDEYGLEPLRELAAHPDLEHRIVGAMALGTLGSSGAVDALVEMLGDGEAAVRYTATFNLGRVGDARAEPALSEVAGSDSEPKVREGATEALQQIASPA